MWYTKRMDHRDVPQTHGVYQIRCRVTGKIYIGSASGKRGFRARLIGHLTRLRLQRHRSKYLQNAVNKYGIAAFEFSILAITTPEEAVSKEQEFLDMLQPWRRNVGFNTNRQATSHLGVKRSATSRQRLSKALQIRMKEPDVRAKMLASGERQARQFVLEKDGVTFSDKNLNRFCRTHGLNLGLLSMVINGHRRSHKGFHLPGNASVQRRYRFVDPEGKVHECTNLNQFCKEKALTQPNMCQLALGRKLSHKGWTYAP